MTICFRGCNVREDFFSGRTIFEGVKVLGSTSSLRQIFSMVNFFYYFVQIFHMYRQLFVSRLMHWQFIGNLLAIYWQFSNKMGSFWYYKNPRNNAAPKQTLLSATSGQDRPRRNIWSERVPARRWDKELFNNKMSFFFDFCFVAFLLWLVIFVASLFLLDGDWSLIFYAKFGKKIRKFALLVQ